MKALKTKSIQKLLKVNQHKKITLGLTRTQKALKFINWEKPKSRILTISGTSAKFSILQIFKKILIDNKNSFAATYSPHIKSITERMEINSKLIKINVLKKILNKVYKIPVPLTEFEKLCVAFAEFIKNKKTDYILAEFGLLGRLDAVRALFPKPHIHIVAPIFFDHLHWTKTKKRNLKTLKEIVYEKISFLSADRIYISKQHSRSLKFIKYYLKKNSSKCFYYGRDFWLKKKNDKYFYQDKTRSFQIHSNLLGDFSHENAVIAIKISIDEGIAIPIIKKSLKKISMLLGRVQLIKSGKLRKGMPKSTLIFADGAHNSLSSQRICDFLYQYKNKDLYAIISMIKSKDPSSFLKPFKKFKKIFFTNMKQNNVYPKEQLNKIAGKLNIPSEITKDCYTAIKTVGDKKKAIFLITGSFYYLQDII